MLTRKLLLLSVAIPLASLPMAVPGHAEARTSQARAAAEAPILVAQADSGQIAPEEKKKRREKARERAEKKAEAQARKNNKKSGADNNSQGAPVKRKQAGKDSRGPTEGQAAADQQKKAPSQPPKKKTDESANDNAAAKEEKAKQQQSKAKAAEERAQKKAQQKKDKAEANKAAASEKAPSKSENAKQTGESAGNPEKRKTRENNDNNAARKQDNAAGERKQPGRNAPEKAGDRKREEHRATDKAASGAEDNAKSAGKRTPLPDQPTGKATATRAQANDKPERLKVRNGAPVLDSEKDAERRRRDNGRRGDKGRDEAQQNRQNEQNRQSRNDRQDNRNTPRKPVRVRSAESEHGQAIKDAPKYQLPKNVKIEKRTNNRVIYNVDNRTIIQNDDHRRLTRNARDVHYERLAHDRTRQVVRRQDGTRVVTIRNSYGDVIHRSRIGRDGREVVLIYTPQDERHDRNFYRHPNVDLPPLRLTEPADDYILDARRADRRQYVTFLEKPPIEPVRDVYSLDQVRYSARLRDIMPRIDLDTITFDTGSSDVGPEAARALSDLGQSINSVLDRDPGQIFLIEGHTDAVGADESNLVLSDERAESVASVLTQDYDVPPENLVTQGYGEEYLKVDTDGAERANRRVTVRRITPLVRPTVQND